LPLPPLFLYPPPPHQLPDQVFDCLAWWEWQEVSLKILRRKGKNIPKPNNCWSQMAKLVPRGIFEVQVTASWNLPEGASTFQKIAIFLVLV
jgi:hypothetical protein